MGAAQSKIPEPAVGEHLVERLKALEVKESNFEDEKGYVHLTKNER